MSHKRYSSGSESVSIGTKWKRNPNRPIVLTEKQQERFWSLVEKTSTCWLWRGARKRVPNSENHYGVFGGTALLAHRIAYTLLVGPIPDGHTLDHLREIGLCSSTLCVNPEHTEPVSSAENSRRMQAPRLKPTCKWGHPRENGKPCKGCNVMNVAKAQAKNPDKYREMRRLNKRNERARKNRQERAA